MQVLDVVNLCRTRIGVPPVSAVNAGDGASAIITSILEDQRVEVLSIGWPFNRETVTLTADGAGNMPVDASYLVTDLPTGYEEVDGRVRNMATGTDVLTPGQTLPANVIKSVEFTKTPQVVANAIAHKVVVQFIIATRGAGSPLLAHAERAYRDALTAAYNKYPGRLRFEVHNRVGRSSGQRLQDAEDDERW